MQLKNIVDARPKWSEFLWPVALNRLFCRMIVRDMTASVDGKKILTPKNLRKKSGRRYHHYLRARVQLQVLGECALHGRVRIAGRDLNLLRVSAEERVGMRDEGKG